MMPWKTEHHFNQKYNYNCNSLSEAGPWFITIHLASLTADTDQPLSSTFAAHFGTGTRWCIEKHQWLLSHYA